MWMYSPYFRPVFWTVMGFLYAITIAGAIYWAHDLGPSMNWWKWLLMVLWYCGLSIGVAASFTFMGEREPKAGGRFLGLTAAIAVVFGVCICFLVFRC
jgi:tryptophan-rich sensory protein